MTSDRPGKTTLTGIVSHIIGTDSITKKTVREVYRLTKVTVYEHDLKQSGTVHYYTINNSGNRIEVLKATLYVCDVWQNNPVNATGIRPTWYAFGDIPFNLMLEDAQSWLPRVLEDDKIIAEVYSRANTLSQDESVQEILVRSILS